MNLLRNGFQPPGETILDRPTSPHAVRDSQHDPGIDLGPVHSASVMARLPAEQAPLLSIVVDCEEEFDWRYPIRGTPYSLKSVPPLRRAAETLARQDAKLTIMATYAIVEHDPSWHELNAIVRDCGAAIGAHMHAWITPPFLEEPTLQNSFQGNLLREVEASKIETLLAAVSARTGEPVRLFRAGRYGFGTSTAEFLAERGIRIDLSFMPHFDYTDTGGASFTGVSCDPFWFADDRRLFEFPMTAGFTGWMKGSGSRLFARLNARSLRYLRLPSVLANGGLLNRVRLSPEGVTLAEAKALTRSLHAQGHRVFHLSFHSTSLVPGAAPYVATDDDAARLVDWLSQYVAFFQTEFLGRVVTPDAIEAAARGALTAGRQGNGAEDVRSALVKPAPVRPAPVRPAPVRPAPVWSAPVWLAPVWPAVAPHEAAAARVSVIIPTYNRADLVERAVRSALEQTYPVSEVIVVDDGSRDATRAVLAGLMLAPLGDRIAYIYQDNQGVSMARNRGIQSATGELIAFLDSDDVWEPWKLALQIGCLQQYPRMVMLGTNAWEVGENGVTRPDFMRTYSVYKSYDRLREQFEEHQIVLGDASATLFFGDFSSPMFLGNFFVTSTVVVRRDVLLQAGLFDVAMLNAGEDYDLFWRICQLGQAGVIDVPSVRFRRGGIDHLHASPQMALSNLWAIERYLSKHPEGPDLDRDLITSRVAESYAWAGRSLFDHDRPMEARPFLRQAINQGAGSLRLRAYEAFTWMPGWTIPAARRAVQQFRRAATLASKPAP
jgi:glycosyltransferase involved in cell wall biosynthesis